MIQRTFPKHSVLYTHLSFGSFFLFIDCKKRQKDSVSCLYNLFSVRKRLLVQTENRGSKLSNALTFSESNSLGFLPFTDLWTEITQFTPISSFDPEKLQFQARCDPIFNSKSLTITNARLKPSQNQFQPRHTHVQILIDRKMSDLSLFDVDDADLCPI